MREVGNLPMERFQLSGQRVELGLPGLRLLAQQPALFFASLAFGGVFRLADRLRHLVRLAIEFFDFDLEEPAGLFELNEAMDIDFDAAVRAVLGDQFDVIDDEFAIEHGEVRGLGVRRSRGQVPVGLFGSGRRSGSRMPARSGDAGLTSALPASPSAFPLRLLTSRLPQFVISQVLPTASRWL